VKLATKGHIVAKMSGSSGVQPPTSDDSPSTPLRGEPEAASGRMSPTNQATNIPKGSNLFADSSVATCFFRSSASPCSLLNSLRRLTFSPDGSLLVTPTGIHKPAKVHTASAAHFATHIFHRGLETSELTLITLLADLSTPIVSLLGLESPSVAVRFSPLLYQMVPSRAPPLFEGDYRMVFAVVTTTTIFIYDTQHPHPLARIEGCHLATINDVAWSSNGQTLVFCSSDGYVTFVRLNSGVLGQSPSYQTSPHTP
jgi:hypothetical protein